MEHECRALFAASFRRSDLLLANQSYLTVDFYSNCTQNLRKGFFIMLEKVFQIQKYCNVIHDLRNLACTLKADHFHSDICCHSQCGKLYLGTHEI